MVLPCRYFGNQFNPLELLRRRWSGTGAVRMFCGRGAMSITQVQARTGRPASECGLVTGAAYWITPSCIGPIWEFSQRAWYLNLSRASFPALRPTPRLLQSMSSSFFKNIRVYCMCNFWPSPLSSGLSLFTRARVCRVLGHRFVRLWYVCSKVTFPLNDKYLIAVVVVLGPHSLMQVLSRMLTLLM